MLSEKECILTDRDIKNWLNRAYNIEIIIRRDKEELEKLKSLINTGMGIDYSKPSVQTSKKNEAPFEKSIDKITEYTEEFEENFKKQLEIKREIRNVINKLDNVLERNILILRHCYFLEWVEIALEMNYSRSQCFKIYNQSIKNIKSILKDET